MELSRLMQEMSALKTQTAEAKEANAKKSLQYEALERNFKQVGGLGECYRIHSEQAVRSDREGI